MRNGPMAMPNFSMALSTCSGVQPSSSRKPPWRPYCSIMRLPMKPSHTPDTTAVFLIFLATVITVAITSLAVLAPRTTSSSFITLAGLKKCRPTTSCGRLVNAAIVHVQRGGVGGQDGTGLHHAVQFGEHGFLDADFFEHGLNHQVGVLQVVVAQRGAQQAMRCSYLSCLSFFLATWAS
jgi:hypothetical protein